MSTIFAREDAALVDALAGTLAAGTQP
jgi:hypothetical protein